MKDICIVLPSNSSQIYYPENKLNCYTTKLYSTLRLDGEYEVGLAEISYPQNWKYKRDGNIIFKVGVKVDVFRVSFSRYEFIVDVINELNQFLKLKSIPCLITYSNQIISIQIKAPMIIEFTDNLNEEFGLKIASIITPQLKDLGGKNIPFTTPPPFVSTKIDDKIKVITSLYVYTNIIDYQFVGNSFAPLLRTISVNEGPEYYGKYIDSIFTNPHYIPVTMNSIDSIEIDIRDDTGTPIQFEAGKVLVKLHFQSKKERFF